MPCVTGDPIAFLHCHLLSRSSGRWNRSTASWSAPALTLLSTALSGRLGRLPARTTETLLIYPRFPHFAQLIPAAAPARNGAAEPMLWKKRYREMLLLPMRNSAYPKWSHVKGHVTPPKLHGDLKNT